MSYEVGLVLSSFEALPSTTYRPSSFVGKRQVQASSALLHYSRLPVNRKQKGHAMSEQLRYIGYLRVSPTDHNPDAQAASTEGGGHEK